MKLRRRQMRTGIRVGRGRVSRYAATTLFLACLGFTGIVNAGLDTPEYPFRKLLEPAGEETARGELGSSEIDEEVFAKVERGFVNLRVVDDNDSDVPVVVRRRATARKHGHEAAIGSETVSFETFPTNRVEIRLRVKEKGNPAATAVVLKSRVRNFEKQVSVSGSNDGRTWKLITKNMPIFDYSRFIDVRNERIDFKPSAFAFFKLEITNISESHQSPLTRIAKETTGGTLASEIERTSFQRSDFRIEDIELIQKKTSTRYADVRRGYSTGNLLSEVDDEKKQSVVTFDTARTPLTRLSVKVDSANFNRAILIEGSDDEDARPKWRRILSTRIGRISLGSFRQEKTAIDLGGERRFRRYRLTIDNLDNPALFILGVSAEGPAYELVFYRTPGKQYHALYGAAGASLPKYDIGSVLTKAKDAETVKYRLGQQEENPGFRTGRGIGLDGKKMMVVAILAMVGVLFWLVLKTLKRVEV
jgi:hypothetical protein